MRIPRRTFSALPLTLAMTMLSAAATLRADDAAGGESYILAGSERAVWLIRVAGGDKEDFDVAVKEIGQDWLRVGKSRVGRPIAAAAVDDRLHVVFPSGQTVVFNLTDRHGAPGASLASPVAVCEASGAFAEAKSSSVVAIVLGGDQSAGPATGPAAKTRPATAPSATAPATKPAKFTARRVRLTNFTALQYVDGQWRKLAQLPPLPFGPRGRVLPAVAGGVLYVYVSSGDAETDADTDKKPGRLLAWKSGAWEELELPPAIASEVPLAVVAVRGRLNLVLAASPTSTAQTAPAATAPARRSLLIAALEGGEWQLPAQPITLNGKVRTWPADLLPNVSRLGENLALLWRAADPGSPEFAVCKPDGQLLAPNPVAVFAKPPFDEKGVQILEYFLWGVLLALLVPMVMLRSRAETGPFALDESTRPAGLLPRFLAMLIDFMPFSLLAAVIFVPDLLTQEAKSWDELVEKLKTIQTQQAKSSRFAFYWIAMMMMHVSYCILMEAKFGATLGKMIFRLRVVGSGARPVSLRETVVRNFVKFIELHPALGLLLPAIVLLILLSRNRQRAGDLVARTAVIRRPRTPATLEAPQPPDTDDAPPE